MEPTRVERKLTAILSADVKGYSRLMGEDEVATIRTLTAYRELMISLIQKYRGRVVDTPGDNLLAEFGSVVDALTCAMEVQRELAQRNAELPDQRKMEFRIGINLGDVVVEGERIYGNGVNIAARVESLAEGGGICISGDAYRQVRNKLDIGFEDLGEQEVKNISEPVRVYRVLIEPDAVGKVIGGTKWRTISWRWPAAAAGVVALVAAVGVATWLRPWKPTVEPASVERMAFPLPNKPSIAILPFTNLSGDPKQDFFSDGTTAYIISKLSKVSNLFVTARTSTFTYKGKPVKVQQVAEELGVRFVLEGSVQRSGDRVRINVQLIDALRGHHLWAEHYDREFNDIFALQDEITLNVMTALQVKLTEGEQARVWRKQTNNLEAYELFLRGLEHYRQRTKADNAQSRQLFERVITLDPNFSDAWCLLGFTHYVAVRRRWSEAPARDRARAAEVAHKAIAANPSYPHAYALLGRIHLLKREYEKSIVYGEKAIALDPNYSGNVASLASTLTYAGRPEEALALVKRAMRLSPFYPARYLRYLGDAYHLMGKYDEAIAAYKTFRNRNPRSLTALIRLAVAYAQAGREKEARSVAAEILKRRPKFSAKRYAKRLLYKDPVEVERVLDALRKAGLPE